MKYLNTLTGVEICFSYVTSTTKVSLPEWSGQNSLKDISCKQDNILMFDPAMESPLRFYSLKENNKQHQISVWGLSKTMKIRPR